MKVKLYVEGLNAWKSRRWITSKKSLICRYRWGGRADEVVLRRHYVC